MSRPLCSSGTTNTPHPSGGWGLTVPQCYGGHGERETPGLIPNPEAKPFSADGTARGTGWESRTPPDTTPRNGVTATAVTPFLHSRADSVRTEVRPPDQGTARRRPRNARPANAIASSAGSATVNEVTDWSANQCQTSPHASCQVAHTATRPLSSNVPRVSTYRPGAPQRLKTTPSAIPRKATASIGTVKTTNCRTGLPTSSAPGAQKLSWIPHPLVAFSIAVSTVSATPKPTDCTTAVRAVPR